MTRTESDRVTRERSRVALVTSDMFPDLYNDDHGLRDALIARGVTVDAVRWDDPAADWPGYDLALIRSTWDYTDRRDEFLAWTRRVPRLANPADVVEWNTDKHYLRELAEAGLPVAPTSFVEPGADFTPPGDGLWVVKPAISASSRDTGRYHLPEEAGLASAHVRRLTGHGRTAMVQPYLRAVDTAGETSVLCTTDGTGAPVYSHAIRKGAMLAGPDVGYFDPHQYTEDISPRTPSEAELSIAARALSAVPGGADRLLYARVDMIAGPDGEPLLVELELTEPSLFFQYAEGAAERFADGIVARL